MAATGLATLIDPLANAKQRPTDSRLPRPGELGGLARLDYHEGVITRESTLVRLTRNLLLTVALVGLFACGGPNHDDPTPPAKVEGGWTLRSSVEVKDFNNPDYVGRQKPDRIWKTQYGGPQDLPVMYFRFSDTTVAFEAFQKWMKNADEFVFWKGRFVVVISTKNISRQFAGDFSENLNPLLK